MSSAPVPMPQAGEIAAPPETYLHELARRLFRQPAAVIGVIFLALVIVPAIFAPIVAPYDPLAQGLGAPFTPPTLQHLFGTDQFGRDVLSRVIYGGRLSLSIGIIAVAIGLVGGLVLGFAAGFAGGWADEGVMRFVDFMLAFPGILLAIAVVIMLGPSLGNLMIAVGVGGIPGFARLIRGSVLAAKEEEFVHAAQALGASSLKVMARHILPNILAPIVVLITVSLADAILAGTGLSYLGLGAKPPTPEWGLMLSDGRDYMQVAWWVSTFPGIAITLAVVGINILGDAMRNAIDPRLRGRV